MRLRVYSISHKRVEFEDLLVKGEVGVPIDFFGWFSSFWLCLRLGSPLIHAHMRNMGVIMIMKKNPSEGMSQSRPLIMVLDQ